jgi:hypothetical protein
MADPASLSVPPGNFYTYLFRLKDDAEFGEPSIRANIRQGYLVRHSSWSDA